MFFYSFDILVSNILKKQILKKNILIYFQLKNIMITIVYQSLKNYIFLKTTYME
jgi:hypothetical protein